MHWLRNNFLKICIYITWFFAVIVALDTYKHPFGFCILASACIISLVFIEIMGKK